MSKESSSSIRRGLQTVLPDEHVLVPEGRYLEDATHVRGLRGSADAVALPSDPDEVAAVVRWCYEHEVAIVPRGGGTGYAGGAVPIDGGVVLSLEKLRAIRQFDPHLWRLHVEAGLKTGEVRRLARENGLMFAPDPGALEDSQIGGNVATNAGGPHTFKYGVTGRWVTGLEVVLPPGEIVHFGGPILKDQAGYDLKSLLIGSEGTLGVITAVWLRLLPAAEAAHPVVAICDSRETGCALLEQILGNGIVPAALEFMDANVLRICGASFPDDLPQPAEFAVVAEADGSADEAERTRAELIDVMGELAPRVLAPRTRSDVEALWRWRDGVSLTVAGELGGKVGEDVVVPIDRLAEALDGIERIGADHDLATASWGHAGDGNVHANFLVNPRSARDLARAEEAARELFALAVELGGSISGEHGIGWLKRGALGMQWEPAATAAQAAVKRAFDPKGLMNPGKKV